MLFQNNKTIDATAQLDALYKALAVIEFLPDGTIIKANNNFLSAMGYELNEIQGKHHRLFVSEDERESPEYAAFWGRLHKGEFFSEQFKRINKRGQEVWIQATYNPVMDANGKVYKVVKFASDITDSKLLAAEREGQVRAINRVQAVIEFDLDGTIRQANENFLAAVGYEREEIIGKHHSIFVGKKERESDEYRAFWAKLAKGEFQAGQFKRFSKDGRAIWIQASYNPIFDMNGKPFKVIKYATDITSQVELMDKVQNLINVNLSQITEAVEEASLQINNVSQFSSETSSNVQAVASGAEQLNASVREIAQSMNMSKDSVNDMAEKIRIAETYTTKLAETAQNMNGIVQLIQAIANQINLLSLNATIESARAGEAGKGFAVVASEVKNLATQAGSATRQIEQEIIQIQSSAAEVKSAVTDIQGSINTVEDYISSTALAVEEQSAVTQTMSSNMHAAADSVENIRQRMAILEESINKTSEATSNTRESAQSIAAN